MKLGKSKFHKFFSCLLYTSFAVSVVVSTGCCAGDEAAHGNGNAHDHAAFAARIVRRQNLCAAVTQSDGHTVDQKDE